MTIGGLDWNAGMEGRLAAEIGDGEGTVRGSRKMEQRAGELADVYAPATARAGYSSEAASHAFAEQASDQSNLAAADDMRQHPLVNSISPAQPPASEDGMVEAGELGLDLMSDRPQYLTGLVLDPSNLEAQGEKLVSLLDARSRSDRGAESAANAAKAALISLQQATRQLIYADLLDNRLYRGTTNGKQEVEHAEEIMAQPPSSPSSPHPAGGMTTTRENQESTHASSPKRTPTHLNTSAQISHKSPKIRGILKAPGSTAHLAHAGFAQSASLSDAAEAVRKRQRLRFYIPQTNPKMNDFYRTFFLLHPEGRTVSTWCSLLMFVIAYELWAGAVRLALGTPQDWWLQTLDLCADGFFVLDGLIMMNTALATEVDAETSNTQKRDTSLIRDRRFICKNYFTNVFPTMLLPSILYFGVTFSYQDPSHQRRMPGGGVGDAAEEEGQGVNFNQNLWLWWIASIPRLVFRLRRLQRYFREQSYNLAVSVSKMLLLQLALVLYMSAHWIGCLYFWAARLQPIGDRTWLDDVPSLFPLYKKGIAFTTTSSYEINLIYSLCLFRGVDGMVSAGVFGMVPKNTVEMVLAITVQFVSVYVAAYVLGTLMYYVLTAQKDVIKDSHTKTMLHLEAFMEERQLPIATRKRLVRYFRFQYKKAVQRRASAVKLPPALDVKVANARFRPVLEKCCKQGQGRERGPFWGCSPQFLNYMVTKLRLVFLMPGDKFQRAADMVLELCFVSSGYVEVLDGDTVKHIIRSDVESPSIVGEVSFFLGVQRQYSVRAPESQDIEMLMLSKEAAEELFRDFPEQQDIICSNLLLKYNMDLKGEHLEEDAGEHEEDPDMLKMSEILKYTLRRRHDEAFQALAWAATHGDIEEVRRMLRKGVDINSSNYDGRTVLHLAAVEGNFRMVELLLAEGAEKNKRDRWGNTPLQDAINNNQGPVIQLLVQWKSELNKESVAARLCDAASAGDLDTLKLILEHGVNPNCGDYDSRTPLHLAAAEGQDKAVEYLIAKGADVNFKDRWGNTALADAVKSGHVQVVEQILSRGGSLTISMGAVEMCNAATEGDVRYLKLLIRCGMDPDLGDYDNRCPIHLAAASGRLLAVTYLLGVCANPNVKDRWGGTPMDDCVRGGSQRHLQCAKLLLCLGGKLGIFNHTPEGDQALSTLHRMDMEDVRKTVKQLHHQGLDSKKPERATHQECVIAHEASAELMQPVQEMKRVFEILTDFIKTERGVHQDLLEIACKACTSAAGFVDKILPANGATHTIAQRLLTNDVTEFIEILQSGADSESLDNLFDFELDLATLALYEELNVIVSTQERGKFSSKTMRELLAKDFNRHLMSMYKVEEMWRFLLLGFASLRPARNVGDTLDIRVFRIEGFAERSGLFDNTDQFVRVNYEGTTIETTVKANAGSTVPFNETLSFLKQKDRHILKVAVLKSDNSGFNNLLAERVIDLSELPLKDWNEFIENAKPVAFELKDPSGKSAGRVFLGLAGIPPADGNRGDQIGLSEHGHRTHFDKAKFDFLWNYFDLHMTDEETFAVYRESVERSRSGLFTPESLLVGSSTFRCRVLEEDSNDIGQLLAHSVVLRVLAWHNIRHFIPYTRRVKLSEGQTLRIIERCIVAVQWGSVKLTHLDASGAKHTVNLGQNEVAGEAWAILNVWGISSVMANSQSAIVLLPWNAFGIWFEMQPKMVMDICASFVNLVWKTSIDPSEAKFQPYEVEQIRAAYSTAEKKRRGGGNQQQRPVLEDVKMGLADEDREKDVIRKIIARILQQTIAHAFDSWREAVEEAAAARAEEDEQKWAVMLEELQELQRKSVERQQIDEAIRLLIEHVSNACQVPWAKSPSKPAILAFIRWKTFFMSKKRPRAESKEHERRMVLREGFRLIEGTWDVVANGASVVYLTELQSLRDHLGEVGTHFFDTAFNKEKMKEEIDFCDWIECWLRYVDGDEDKEEGDDFDQDESLRRAADAQNHLDRSEHGHNGHVKATQDNTNDGNHEPNNFLNSILFVSNVQGAYARLRHVPITPLLDDSQTARFFEPSFVAITGDLKNALPRNRVKEFLALLLIDFDKRLTNLHVDEFMKRFSQDGPKAKAVLWINIQRELHERRDKGLNPTRLFLKGFGSPLNPNSHTIRVWRTLSQLGAVYLFLLVPVRIAFNPYPDVLAWGHFTLSLDLAVDCLTFLNLIITFNTAYVNKKSGIVIDRVKIARHYLSTDFLADVIVAAPFDWIGYLSGADQRLSSCFRLPKMLWIWVVFSEHRHREHRTGLIHIRVGILKDVIVTLMMLHVFGCILFLLGKDGPRDQFTWWRNPDIDEFELDGKVYGKDVGWPYEYAGFGNQHDPDSSPSISVWRQYLLSVYWVTSTITTMGETGDMSPKNYIEVLFTMVLYVLNITWFSHITGEVCAHVLKADEEVNQIRAEMGSVESYLKSFDLPEALKLEIKRYFQGNSIMSLSSSDVLDGVSQSLRLEMSSDLTQKCLDSSMFFKGCSDNMKDSIKGLLREVRFASEEYLIQINTVAHDMYFVITGWVERISVDHEGAETVEARIGAGGSVGILEGYFGIRYIYSSRAASIGGPCSCLRLVRNQLLTILKLHPDDDEVVAQNAVSEFQKVRQATKSVHHGNSVISGARSIMSQRKGARVQSLNIDENESDDGSDRSLETADENNTDIEPAEQRLDAIILSEIEQKLASLNARRKMERIALFCNAASRGEIDKLERSMRFGVHIDATDINGRTALHCAACQGRPETVRFLLEARASLNIRDRFKNTPLNDAVRHKHDSVAALLRTFNAWPITLPGYEMGVQMCTCASEGDLDQLQRMIENDVDVNTADYDKRTALHLASSQGHLNILEFLIKRGAKVDAMRHGHIKVQKCLRAHGGELLGLEVSVEMCHAAATGDVLRIETLIENGANPNAGDYDNRTALHLAASNGQVSVLDYLMRHSPVHVNVNPADRTGGTPTEDAYRHGHMVAVAILEASSGVRQDNTELVAMAEKAHSDMELRQRHERASKIREVVQNVPETKACIWVKGRCGKLFLGQLRELAQLNQDLIKDMDTMMEAVSAFVAVSSSADIVDMRALIVIHHREYNDVVRAMCIMNETVRQWRATAHNLSHHMAEELPQCKVALIFAREYKTEVKDLSEQLKYLHTTLKFLHFLALKIPEVAARAHTQEGD